MLSVSAIDGMLCCCSRCHTTKRYCFILRRHLQNCWDIFYHFLLCDMNKWSCMATSWQYTFPNSIAKIIPTCLNYTVKKFSSPELNPSNYLLIVWNKLDYPFKIYSLPITITVLLIGSPIHHARFACCKHSSVFLIKMYFC